MAQDSREFPNIYKAALEMSYDNGGINRFRTEEQHRADLDSLLGSEGYYYDDLKQIDTFISTLTEEEVTSLVSGDVDVEMKAVLDKAPTPEIREKVDGLMNAIFDGVC